MLKGPEPSTSVMKEELFLKIGYLFCILLSTLPELCGNLHGEVLHLKDANNMPNPVAGGPFGQPEGVPQTQCPGSCHHVNLVHRTTPGQDLWQAQGMPVPFGSLQGCSPSYATYTYSSTSSTHYEPCSWSSSTCCFSHSTSSSTIPRLHSTYGIPFTSGSSLRTN